MRRLPIYLLLDTSGSMHGEPIEAVKNGIQTLQSSLNSDPYALETAYLSIITFDSAAKQISPLTEIAMFQQPELHAGGCTAMGEALKLLCTCVDRDVHKSTPEAKGDWRPLVFVMTDGEPTDDITAGVEEIKRRKWGIIVACAAGQGANTDYLKRFTENVVSLATTDSTAMKEFFKWVSSSIQTASKSVDLGKEIQGSLSELPAPPPEVNVVL
jgi:uncharacterized protein YegL